MAVFLLNNCKFTGCGRGFSTLADLIHHIEDSHIDVDPKLLEKQETQQPSSLALSYILKHYSKGSSGKKDSTDNRKKCKTQLPVTLLRSNTPTGSEAGDEEEVMSEDEDSDDSYTTQEQFTTELILGMMQNLKDDDGDKPFACPVPGCKKRYKNVNGMKYHARHGHRKDSSLCCRIKKAFKCRCGKSYRHSHGLRNHMILHHSNSDLLKTCTSSSLPVTTTTAALSTAQSKQITKLPSLTSSILAIPSSGTQSVLSSGDVCPASISLVPITSSKQAQFSVANNTAIQLITCPQMELMATEPNTAKQ